MVMGEEARSPGQDLSRPMYWAAHRVTKDAEEALASRDAQISELREMVLNLAEALGDVSEERWKEIDRLMAYRDKVLPCRIRAPFLRAQQTFNTGEVWVGRVHILTGEMARIVWLRRGGETAIRYVYAPTLCRGKIGGVPLFPRDTNESELCKKCLRADQGKAKRLFLSVVSDAGPNEGWTDEEER